MIKNIAIVTESSPVLGMGHLQRMASLCEYLNSKENFTASIIISKDNPYISNDFPKIWIKDSISSDTSIILRDKRDSTTEEVKALKEIAPTITIDDNGEGRAISNYNIDILPNIVFGNSTMGKFIYGYNFTQSIADINYFETRNIDVSIYRTNFNKDYIDIIIKKLSRKYCIAILGGKNIDIIKNNNIIERLPQKYYASMLYSSKLVITHFGITIYESRLLSTDVIILDPTDYHHQLSLSIKDKLHIDLLGLWSDIDINKFTKLISNRLDKTKEPKKTLINFKEEIEENLKWYGNFLSKI